VFIDIYYFCFSCSGWGIGPCGGVVEPEVVAKMRSDEGSGDNFFDSDDDVDEVVPVNYHDLVPEMFSEEGQLRRDRVKEIFGDENCAAVSCQFGW